MKSQKIISNLQDALHNHMTKAIDATFPPTIYENEKEYWDRLWKERLEQLNRTGLAYEHDNWSKRFLYEKVVESIEYSYGKPLRGTRILEFGAGSGYAVCAAAMLGARGVVVDYSCDALVYAQALAKKLNVEDKIDFFEASFFSGLKLSSPVDICFNSGVIEHYNDSECVNILQAMSDTVRPGGLIFTAVPNLTSPVMLSRMIKSGTKGSEQFFSQSRLKKLFELSGLNNSKAGAINYLLPIEAHPLLWRIASRTHAERWASSFSGLIYRYARVMY